MLEIRHIFWMFSSAMAVALDWLQQVLVILGPTAIFAKTQILRALLKRSQVVVVTVEVVRVYCHRTLEHCESLIVIKH